jgi:hypothetical protein
MSYWRIEGDFFFLDLFLNSSGTNCYKIPCYGQKYVKSMEKISGLHLWSGYFCLKDCTFYDIWCLKTCTKMDYIFSVQNASTTSYTLNHLNRTCSFTESHTWFWVPKPGKPVDWVPNVEGWDEVPNKLLDCEVVAINIQKQTITKNIIKIAQYPKLACNSLPNRFSYTCICSM